MSIFTYYHLHYHHPYNHQYYNHPKILVLILLALLQNIIASDINETEIVYHQAHDIDPENVTLFSINTSTSIAHTTRSLYYQPTSTTTTSTTIKTPIKYNNSSFISPSSRNTSFYSLSALSSSSSSSPSSSFSSGNSNLGEIKYTRIEASALHPPFHREIFPELDTPSFVMPSIPRLPMRYSSYLAFQLINDAVNSNGYKYQPIRTMKPPSVPVIHYDFSSRINNNKNNHNNNHNNNYNNHNINNININNNTRATIDYQPKIDVPFPNSYRQTLKINNNKPLALPAFISDNSFNYSPRFPNKVNQYYSFIHGLQHPLQQSSLTSSNYGNRPKFFTLNKQLTKPFRIIATKHSPSSSLAIHESYLPVNLQTTNILMPEMNSQDMNIYNHNRRPNEFSYPAYLLSNNHVRSAIVLRNPSSSSSSSRSSSSSPSLSQSLSSSPSSPLLPSSSLSVSPLLLSPTSSSVLPLLSSPSWQWMKSNIYSIIANYKKSKSGPYKLIYHVPEQGFKHDPLLVTPYLVNKNTNNNRQKNYELDTAASHYSGTRDVYSSVKNYRNHPNGHIGYIKHKSKEKLITLSPWIIEIFTRFNELDKDGCILKVICEIASDKMGNHYGSFGINLSHFFRNLTEPIPDELTIYYRVYQLGSNSKENICRKIFFDCRNNIIINVSRSCEREINPLAALRCLDEWISTNYLIQEVQSTRQLQPQAYHKSSVQQLQRNNNFLF